jgi:hypothetical protein
MNDLKPIVLELGEAIERGEEKSKLFALIYQALKLLADREVGFIDTSGEDPTKPD